MLCLSIPAFAYDFEADGYYFNITDETNKEVEVTYKDTSYSSYSGVANIPATVNYNGDVYTVTTIGASAFCNCKGLLSVTIPNTVTKIGTYAFYYEEDYYVSLRSVTMGAALTEIGTYAFSSRDYGYDRNFTIPKVIWLCNTPPSGVDEVKAAINYVSNNQFKLYDRKVYPFLSSKFEVDGVVYVPVSPSDRTCDVIDCNYAPASTEIKIDEIVVNKGVELKVLDINNFSFYKNDEITSLSINNKGYIGNYAFCGCDALISIEANNNGYIGDKAFYGCDNLKSVLANNRGYIGDETFEICKNLKNLTLGDAITAIGQSAFKDCSALPTVSIPDNVSSVGKSIFSGCSALESANIGRGLGIIPEYAFKNCSSLKSLSIPNNIGRIENYAFSGCSSLGDVKIEDDEQIDNDTHPMQSFPDWTSTNHSNNSISYKEYTFDVIPGDVLTFDYSVSSGNGYDCLTIELNGARIVRESGSKWGSYRKVFDTGKQISLYMAYTKVSSNNSSGEDMAYVINIGLNEKALHLGFNENKPLFSGCPLDEVYIGRKLSYYTNSSYGYSPFYRNTSLRSVKITDAETEIYDNEFYGCSNLQEFSCGDGVESIGKWAFSGCSAMKSYASGSNVKTIGDEAFSDCTGLTSFSTSAVVPPTCGNQALDDINKWECVLHVPSESIDDYKAAEQWKEFFFVEPTSGIENVAVDGAEVKVTVEKGGFTFGADAERDVEVYSIDGQSQYSATVQPGERVSLPAGLYIVRIGTQTVKVRI